MRIHGRQQEDHDLSFGAKLACIAAMLKAFKLAEATCDPWDDDPSARHYLPLVVHATYMVTLDIYSYRCSTMDQMRQNITTHHVFSQFHVQMQ
jgi:hypothetical protein